MALHYDGFEQFVGEQQAGAALRRAGYFADGSIVTSLGRYGSTALALTNASVYRTHPFPGNSFTLGAAHQFADRGVAMWVGSATEYVVLWTNEVNGNPYLNETPMNSIPIKGRFYYYEIEIDRSAALVKLYVNGRHDGSYPLPASIGAAAELTAGIGLPVISTNGYPPAGLANSTRHYDDLYIIDGPPLGPLTVTTRFPTIDKLVEWVTAGQAGNNGASQILSRLPPGMNDAYVASDVVGSSDKFISNKSLNNSQRIVATGMVMLARKSADFNGKLRGFVGDDINAAYRDGVITVDDTWRMQYLAFPENGGDTKVGIEAAEFGMQVAP